LCLQALTRQLHHLGVEPVEPVRECGDGSEHALLQVDQRLERWQQAAALLSFAVDSCAISFIQ
jgi:hypothetical protein